MYNALTFSFSHLVWRTMLEVTGILLIYALCKIRTIKRQKHCTADNFYLERPNFAQNNHSTMGLFCLFISCKVYCIDTEQWQSIKQFTPLK